jgi:hypothetical protein
MKKVMVEHISASLQGCNYTHYHVTFKSVYAEIF